MNGFKRLTTDKPNGMYELAHNSCYIGDDGAARYRDFNTDIDARDVARKLMVAYGVWQDTKSIDELADRELIHDETFDDSMIENLMYETTEITGLIALFYRNLWAMADLRECLKQYEDAEEQGLLLKLPCKVGDTVYNLVPRAKKGNEYNTDKVEKIVIRDNSVLLLFECGLGKYIDQIGKSMFLTKEEAEAALAKLEGEV